MIKNLNPELIVWMRWALSGFLFAFAFLHPWFFWLIMPAVGIFIYAAINSVDLRSAAIGGWMAGTIKIGGSLAWVFNMYPLDWLGIDSAPVQILVIILYWFGAALSIGLGMMIASVGIKALHRQGNYFLLLAPLLLSASEICGSLLFSLYALGPGGYLNLNFTHGYMGYALAGFPWVIEVARWGGVYALSSVAGMAGLIIYLVVSHRSHKGPLLAALGMLVLILFVTAGSSFSYYTSAQSEASPTAKVVAVHTYVSANAIATEAGRAMRKRVVHEAVDAALKLSPEAVVLPEMSDFSGGFNSADETLSYLSSRGQSILVDSGIVTDTEGKKRLRATIFDPENDRFYITDKKYLVPQGETIAYHTIFILRLLGQTDFLERFSAHRSFDSGAQDENAVVPKDIPGVLFCFSSIAPNEITSLVREQHPAWIAHIVSHSWFNGSALLSRQLDQILRVQAVSSGIPIIKAGNMSGSGAYYPDGSVSTGTIRAIGDHWRLYEYEF